MGRAKWIVIFAVAVLLFSSYNMKPLSFANATSAVTAPDSINTPPAGALIVPDEYPTIQAAIGNASAGDTVFVKKGTYYYDAWGIGFDDGITIDKPISLIGEDSQTTILKPNYESHYGAQSGIHITGDDVTISGFTIDGVADNSTFEGTLINSPNVDQTFGILIAPVSFQYEDNDTHVPSGCRIIGNNIINNGEFGIQDNGKNDLISGNNITDDKSLRVIDDSGIELNSSGTVVSGNNVIGMGYWGIDVSTCINVTIKQNNIMGNGVDNRQPIEDVGGLFLSNQGHGSVYVYDNNITDNSGFGVEFDLSNNCAVYNNNILRNGIGIYLPNYEITTYTGWVGSFGSGNKVYYNNLISNGQNVFIEHTDPFTNLPRDSYVTVIGNGTDVVSWDNGLVGNYWSDYHGQGTYVIDQNNIDQHPLTQQVNISTIAPTVPSFILTIAIVTLLIVVVASLLLYRRHQKNSNLNQNHKEKLEKLGFKETKRPEIIESEVKPTKETHPQYDFIYGPFKTREEASRYVKAMTGLACGEG